MRTDSDWSRQLANQVFGFGCPGPIYIVYIISFYSCYLAESSVPNIQLRVSRGRKRNYGLLMIIGQNSVFLSI